MSKFSQWTTQSAFAVNLNKIGIGHLLSMKALEDHNGAEWKGHSICNRMSANYLLRRGLITDTKDELYMLTTPGRLMAELLIEAGFGYKQFHIDPKAEDIIVDKSGVLNLQKFHAKPIESPEIVLRDDIGQMEKEGENAGW